MRVLIVAEGRLKEPALRALVDGYLSRIRRYVRCDELEVKDAAAEFRARTEATRVVLEVSGEALSSQALSKRIERWGSHKKGQIGFFIGGPEGLPRELAREADASLSLSSLTLPHRLARLLLAEQIYRSLSILRGEPYAREA